MRVTSSQSCWRNDASTWSAISRSSVDRDGIATSSAVAASRSLTVLLPLDAHPVLAQHVVQLGGRVPFALVQPPHHEDARQPEGAAGIGPWPRRPDTHAPRRDHSARKLFAGLRIDHRYPGVQDAPLAEDSARPHPGPLGDHATTAYESVVGDHNGSGLRRLEHAADPYPSGEVDTGTDLGAATDGRPSVGHGPPP